MIRDLVLTYLVISALITALALFVRKSIPISVCITMGLIWPTYFVLLYRAVRKL